VQLWAAGRPAARLPDADPAQRSVVVAQARTADGTVAGSRLETGEGYAFTAESAVRAVEAVLADPVPGAYSPGAFLGADFVLDIPGTSCTDLPGTAA
jgi:short subunit dehydrogenase-like uncharacterized protein